MDSSIGSIFKAYDIRGKVGPELNPSFVTALGRGFADWLPNEGAVAVGRDMRPDSAALAAAMIDGLRQQGRDVMDIGEVTSDMIYFVVGHYGLAGGAMITASHNPGEYNGIKLCGEAARPVGEATGLFDIRDAMINGEYKPTATNAGSVSEKDVSEDWISHVMGFIDPPKLKKMSLVVDAGNGMAGKIFPELEPYVPWQIDELYFELDGTFPNHEANPLKSETLAEMIRHIKEQKLDGGIAFDGDGDRAVLVDETGQPLSGTELTAILATYFLQQSPGATILYNAICGRAAVEAIKKAGGTAVRTRVGHSFIKAKMRNHDAVFGGEHSGHYYFKDNFMADSGLIAAVVGLYVCGLSGKKLSQLAAPYRSAYVQIPETNFEVSDKEATIAALAEAFKDEQTDMLDGLTVNFPNAWFNVRPSNTEPLLRLNAEAKTQGELDALVSKVKQHLAA